MTLQDFLNFYPKNKAKILKQINEFFADVVYGVGNWEWRKLFSGRTTICDKNSVFSDGWSVLDKESAIYALTKLSDETGIDFSEEIKAITESRGVQIHSVLPYNLYKVVAKSDTSPLIAA